MQTLEDVPGDRFYLVREDTGLVQHQILDPQAQWDDATSTLTVFARSNYGGRARIEVEGVGPLTYYSLDITYRAQFVLPSRPPSIRLLGDLGGEVVIPVP